jgi:23S rRNA (guanosine2251-2'-O)-methyltransferase
MRNSRNFRGRDSGRFKKKEDRRGFGDRNERSDGNEAQEPAEPNQATPQARGADREPNDVVYGRWPVREALNAGPVGKIFIARGATGGPVDEIVALAKQKRVPFHFVERHQIDRMSGGADVVHQGVVAMVQPMAFADLNAVFDAAKASQSKGARLLFLDGITDPHNLGSLLRSAVYFGVAGAVIPKWRAATLTSTVVRSSAGAARLIPVAQVSNLVSAMELAKKEGFWIVGADMDGVNSRSADLPRPFGLVLGSEGEGLHALVKKKCDVIVAIRRPDAARGIDSLNVGVAGGILLGTYA